MQFGPWEVESRPNDGGRLTALRYCGQDLLTVAPSNFRPPFSDYGRYETRPVYGYDDCFPTVDACNFPGREWAVPDHGELCWLAWDMTRGEDCLRFRCQSEKLPVVFERLLKFTSTSVEWRFKVANSGGEALPFVHVMHALMPLQEIVHIELPEFSRAIDEANGSRMYASSTQDIEGLLFALERGKASMLILRNIDSGRMSITFRSGIVLEISFLRDLFPALGIWWNHGGYPDEEGCRRTECAFEPIPGAWSSLAASVRDGIHLQAPPYASVNWAIYWKITPERP